MNESSILIRTVEPTDWEAYRDLRLRALTTDPLAFGSTFEREQAFTEDRWRERLSRGALPVPRTTWAAEEGRSGFVGMVVAARIGGAIHIFGMWVAPEFRGRGIGGRLLDTALSWITNVAPGSPVQLEVNPRELAAVHLYQSRGFRATGKSAALEHSPGERVIELIRPA
jgi:ribosomal protein S18 acetylase RimI-like enzyme